MTKFIYLADSHCGSNLPGYQQQHAYPERLSEIVRVLKNYIAEEKVDFVLHGGDMIDFTNGENIRIGAELFGTLGVPAYLCLGNHDLTTPDALQRWLQLAPQFIRTKNRSSLSCKLIASFILSPIIGAIIRIIGMWTYLDERMKVLLRFIFYFQSFALLAPIP